MPQNSRNRQSKPSTASKKVSYSPLTPSLAFQLAAPHTWVAAIMPVLFSIEYSAITYSGKVSILLALILLAICILMQSAVNVLNDYFDFKKGTDSVENSSDDAFDAVLVYNNLNPKSVCALAIGFLIVAAGMGFYLVYLTGWILLVIGLIGALIVFLYSGGKTPISYMPIGELVSGFVMGGLIPLACCYTLSGVFEPLVLLVALPFIFGIGMILFTNNTCDRHQCPTQNNFSRSWSRYGTELLSCRDIGLDCSHRCACGPILSNRNADCNDYGFSGVSCVASNSE